MILRPYQQTQFENARINLRQYDSAVIQAPTGAGKTPVASSIMKATYERGNSVWLVVPRNELEDQASAHLFKHHVPHGQIASGKNESRAFKVHVVSKDTLIRRYGRIKNWPDLIIFDECHIALKRQIEIVETGNAARAAIGKPPMKVIGFTATPERLDGLGLSKKGGGLYDTIDYGPTISELMAGGYLSGMRYFRPPPPEGIHDLTRRGTEFDAEELDALLEKRKIYGEVVGHYEKYGLVKSGASISLPGEPTAVSVRHYCNGRPALIFTRDVKTAYAMAERFQLAGYKFYCIEGTMAKGERKKLIDAHRLGLIDGLTNCEIATYGLDVPRIEYVAMLRLTASRALNFQMVGRGLRPFDERDEAGEITYRKEDVVICDHVDLLGIHGHPMQKVDWNFDGIQKKKRGKNALPSLTVCPVCALYFEGPTCPNCGAAEPPKPAQKIAEVAVELIEAEKPTALRDRPAEQRREYVDRINQAISDYLETEELERTINPGAVGALLEIAEALDRQPMWVYWLLVQKRIENIAARMKITVDEYKAEYAMSVNVPLLSEIARQRKYKPGWVRFKSEEIRRKAS
jgi:superfamily II DNA or RNA helicase